MFYGENDGVREGEFSSKVGPCGRVDYLRVSVTDRCNLRCIYCMPYMGIKLLPSSEILSYEELALVCRAASSIGIRKVRITGGEPLVRKNVVRFVEMLSSIEPALDISMTTNGVLLSEFAESLKAAGLSRINVSLDALDPETYRNITRRDGFGEVMDGISRAIEIGMDPVKVNVVTLKGINDDIRPFVRLTYDLPVHVRFIEYMPQFGNAHKLMFVSGGEIMAKIKASFKVEDAETIEAWGPAKRHYRAKGALGTFALISPVSSHFCPDCNRLRVSCSGILRACLFDRDGFNLGSLLRSSGDVERVAEVLRMQLARKRDNFSNTPFSDKSDFTGGMFSIGG